MKRLTRFLLGVIFVGLLLLTLLYIAVSSGYVFGKIADYFAPKYGVRYEKISGNFLDGITIDGLYYHDKKLARSVKIALNPATLPAKKITFSHLVLNDVDETVLETIIADAGSGDDNSSSSFPFSLRVKDMALSLLPFTVGKIHFYHASLKLDSLDYASSDFRFGTLRLIARSTLGNADIKGHYAGRVLHVSDLNIGNLDTEEIEKLLDKNAGNAPHASEDNATQTPQAQPSVFVPKSIVVQRLKVALLPRKYHGVSLSLLTLEGGNVTADLKARTLAGDANLTVITDVARGTLQLHDDHRTIRIQSLRLSDANVTKILALIPDTNATKALRETPSNIEQSPAALSIPFVANTIAIDAMHVQVLPFVYHDVHVARLTLGGDRWEIDWGKRLLKKGHVVLDAKSDIATLHHEGNVTMNRLVSRMELLPKKALIRRYKLPLRPGALTPITVRAYTDTNGTKATIGFKASRLLDAKPGAFNIDLNPSTLTVHYGFASGLASGVLDARFVTPYTPQAKLHTDWDFKDSLHFQGSLTSPTIASLNSKLAKWLNNAKITFAGNPKHFSARAHSDGLQIEAADCNATGCLLHGSTLAGLDWGRFVDLPKALEKARGTLTADMPLTYAHLLPLKADVTLHSNIATVAAKVRYHDTVKVDATVTIPPKTLLKTLDKNIRFDALSPMHVTASYGNDSMQASAQAHSLHVNTRYDLASKAISGTVTLPGASLLLSGSVEKTLILRQKTTAIRSLIQAVHSLYRVELPDVSGDLALVGKITKLSSASLRVQSRQMRIGKDPKNATKISNLSFTVEGNKEKITIPRYRLNIAGMELYANRPSTVRFKGESITFAPLWVNDALTTTGTYHFKTKKGTLASTASQLQIHHELADFATALKLKTQIQGDKTTLRGSVHLHGGTIAYDINAKHFAADSDIIIKQRHTSSQNAFTKNVALDVLVDSTKPLWYKKQGIRIALIPKLTLRKHFGASLKANGDIGLLPGGYYTFEGKRFVLQKSRISFRGKLTAPILHINLLYRNKGVTVRIKVSGTASDPVLAFKSDPHMTRDQILSFIMFDTRPDSHNIAGGDVSHRLASALVKSVFSSMGLKLDEFILNGSGFQVGTKISDRISVMYTQEKESSIQFRIKNTKHIETDIRFGHDSRSVDIFYKKEF